MMKKIFFYNFLLCLMICGVIRAEEIPKLAPPSLPVVEPAERLRRPEIQTLSIPELPVIESKRPAFPEWALLSIPELPVLDPTKMWTYNNVDMSGGMNSAYLLKSANQCDEAINFLPDSFPGIVARGGFDRLNDTSMTQSDSTIGVYGLGVYEDQVLAQGDSFTCKLVLSSYTPTKIGYSSLAHTIYNTKYLFDAHALYLDHVKVGDRCYNATLSEWYTVDSVLSDDSLVVSANILSYWADTNGMTFYPTNTANTPTFIESFKDGAIISNGTDEPFLWDGNNTHFFGTIWRGKADSVTADVADTVKIWDVDLSLVADAWIGYPLQTNKAPTASKGEVRTIIDNGTDWIKITKGNTGIKTYRIIGGWDRSAVIDSGISIKTPLSFWVLRWDAENARPDSVRYKRSNCYIYIKSGTGSGQLRHIRYSQDTTFYIDPPWDIEPDSSSFITFEYSIPRGNNGVIHKDCFVVSGGFYRDRIYWSEPNEFSYFKPENYVAVGGEVNYLLKFGGVVWVFENDRVERLFGNPISGFYLTSLVGNIGCPYPHTIATWGGNIYWLANNGVWTTKGSGIAYAEGEAGLTKISGPIDNHLKDLRRRAKYAGAGFDGSGNYWLSISITSDTIPNTTFVWSTKYQSWWKQEPFAFSYFAFAEYPGDTSGFIFARQDSGYIFKYGASTDAGAAIEYTYKKVLLENDQIYEKALKNFWLLGTLADSVWAKFYENESATCAESLKISGSGKTRMFDYISPVIAEKITVELKSWDTNLVIDQWGVELENLGRRQK